MTVQVQASDSCILAPQVSEVEQFTNEGIPPIMEAMTEAFVQPERQSGCFSLVAGGALSVGPFGTKDHPDAGLATFGFVAGVELAHILAGSIYVAIGGMFVLNDVATQAAQDIFGTVSANNIDVTSWKKIAPSITQWLESATERTRCFFAEDFGYVFSSSPEVKIEYVSMSITQESRNGNAPAFGGRIIPQTSGSANNMSSYPAAQANIEWAVIGPGAFTSGES